MRPGQAAQQTPDSQCVTDTTFPEKTSMRHVHATSKPDEDQVKQHIANHDHCQEVILPGATNALKDGTLPHGTHELSGNT